MNKRIFWALAGSAALVIGAVPALNAHAGNYRMSPGMMGGAPAATRAGPAASGPQYYGMGPGMMQGYGYGRYGKRGGYGRYGMGPGMMHGYGGYGMGPGMMGGYGGYGMGPGMMYGYGGYGMGPGMMSGFGMGPGMMGGYGGYGMGRGMLGGYGAYALGLSSDQRDKIAGIWNGSIAKAWPLMGQLREQYFRFSQLMAETSPDRAAVNKVYARISELQRQLLDQRLDARKQMIEVLTPDQRKKLEQGFYHHWQ